MFLYWVSHNEASLTLTSDLCVEREESECPSHLVEHSVKLVLADRQLAFQDSSELFFAHQPCPIRVHCH